MSDIRKDVLERIDAEREFQDAQWGGPSHDAGHDDATWLLILTKQLGTASNAILLVNDVEPPKWQDEAIEHELVQAAAVMLAWLESRALRAELKCRAEPSLCELGIHCDGKGKIQMHVVNFGILVCIKCAAGEEGLTQKKVREDLREPMWKGIHRARAGHRLRDNDMADYRCEVP